jgi:hypothetical protein
MHLHKQTNELSPQSNVLPKRLTVPQPVKETLILYETRRFNTAFTTAHHPFLGQVSPVYTTPSILILFSYLLLGLPSGLFLSGLPTKTLYAPLPYPICATCPAHLTLFDVII